jgi:digeranylgeranylglycerophospholipid reductase
MLRVQRLIPRIAPHVLAGGLKAMEMRRFVHWSFNHYLAIAHPDFAAGRAPRRRPLPAAA